MKLTDAGNLTAGRAFLAVAVAATLVQVPALAYGWWLVTFAAGLAAGVLVRGWATAAGLAAGTLAAWTGVAYWQSGGRALEVADLVGAILLRERGTGWVVLVVTGAYALLLALAGGWLGAAARRAVAAWRADTPVTSAETAAAEPADTSGANQESETDTTREKEKEHA